jgi:Zn-dependent peptidase ImmA (M78 family)
VAVLGGAEKSAFSAMTVFRGMERTIVHNDTHVPARQASNLAHELAHGLLLHPARPALNAAGCRDWDAEIEHEATYLAGALLIPSKAIWWAAKQRQSREAIAQQYRCSMEMVLMRLNLTGAGKRFA